MKDAGSRDGLPFVKMHGAGNDFVILEARGAVRRATPALVRALGDRHRGIGFDQLVEVAPAGAGAAADLSVDFWNADGSPSAACGNATRCIAAREMARRGTDLLRLATAGGTLEARRAPDGAVWVNMGAPRFDWRDIPLARAVDTAALPLPGAPAAVGMGNPHCVTFVADAAAVDLDRQGPRIEHDPLFPERANAGFAEIRDAETLRLRVWERGTGITLACGSGACAAAVAAHRRGLTGRRVAVEMDGGWLAVDWRDDGVWLSGPTAPVFEGVIDPALLEAAG